MIFLTVNDTPSGVFKSQVVDVVAFLNQLSKEEVRLVSFISIRNYRTNRRTIKSWCKNATVIPMIPGIQNWKKNLFSLRSVKNIKTEKIIARGVMAFYLANKLNARVIYDGRGAVKAELIEFPEMIPNKKVVNNLIEAEARAVHDSFFKIAVSNKLVEYWKTEFDYAGSNHVVIPCTVSNAKDPIIEDKKRLLRNEFGFKETDIILIYSGGISGWQSFHLLEKNIDKWVNDESLKIVFLSPTNVQITELEAKYPNSVFQKWVHPEEVHDILLEGDYGILIRDENVTNRVSSPVKFAEYLAAGLKVIISSSIGDYSEIVEKENLGIIFHDKMPSFKNTTIEERNRAKNFVSQKLSKTAFTEIYRLLIS